MFFHGQIADAVLDVVFLRFRKRKAVVFIAPLVSAGDENIIFPKAYGADERDRAFARQRQGAVFAARAWIHILSAPFPVVSLWFVLYGTPQSSVINT